MGDSAQSSFEGFESGEGPGRTPPRAGFGRPAGAKNKTSEVIWRMARVATPKIMTRLIERAERLEDEIDFKCAQVVLSRTWVKPRSAPLLHVDLSGGNGAVLNAVQAGEITPADAASLMNATSKNALSMPAEAGGEDIRKVVSDKLEGIINARAAQEPEGEPAAAPAPEPDTPGCQAANHEPDADELSALADEIEALARKLEDDDGQRDSE
jgi:hypothetical protein